MSLSASKKFNKVIHLNRTCHIPVKSTDGIHGGHSYNCNSFSRDTRRLSIYRDPSLGISANMDIGQAKGGTGANSHPTDP